jgi:uncharacterized protein
MKSCDQGGEDQDEAWKSRSINQYDHEYVVDHIIVDHVGACVASTLKEMEWNAQGKGIT